MGPCVLPRIGRSLRMMARARHIRPGPCRGSCASGTVHIGADLFSNCHADPGHLITAADGDAVGQSLANAPRRRTGGSSNPVKDCTAQASTHKLKRRQECPENKPPIERGLTTGKGLLGRDCDRMITEKHCHRIVPQIGGRQNIIVCKRVGFGKGNHALRASDSGDGS